MTRIRVRPCKLVLANYADCATAVCQPSDKRRVNGRDTHCVSFPPTEDMNMSKLLTALIASAFAVSVAVAQTPAPAPAPSAPAPAPATTPPPSAPAAKSDTQSDMKATKGEAKKSTKKKAKKKKAAAPKDSTTKY